MAVYLVTPLAANFDQLGTALKAELSAEDVLELQHRAGYLVSFGGTSVDLSNKIGITSAAKDAPAPTIGSALVTSVTAYYGRGSTSMWEWLRLRFEKL